MRRVRLRRKFIFKYRLKKSDKLILIILLLFISIILSLKYISKNITPVFLNYAEIEARKFIGAVINKAIMETKINDNDLFNISISNDEINMIDFNMNNVNEILTNVNYKIQSSMLAMDKGEYLDIPGYDSEKLKRGVIYELPTGLVFENNLLSNIGPKIPIKLSMRGSILSNIDTSITNYGINNALLKVYINLNINQQIVLPFTLKKIEVDTSVPVVIKLIKGSVPKYYSGGISESSPIVSIPLEEN